MTRDTFDPKGLIAESYRIDGISAAECRSIFFDWALSADVDGNGAGALGVLLARYGAAHPDHPMTSVLREGLGSSAGTGRRGGRAARRPGSADH